MLQPHLSPPYVPNITVIFGVKSGCEHKLSTLFFPSDWKCQYISTQFTHSFKLIKADNEAITTNNNELLHYNYIAY
jgi:hypothetical protein